MKLSVLVDNNTLIDRFFLGEPSISIHIKDDSYSCLFDVGYSNIFITNANKLGIDLLQINSVVISHGHLDHTWGLDSLVKLYNEAKVEKKSFIKPKLIAHPNTFLTKKNGIFEEIGTTFSKAKISRHLDVSLSIKPIWLTKRLVFLGEIPRTNDFENQKPTGKFELNNKFKDDYLLDDSAMAYKSSKGIVVITGCSHAGICNIVEYAKKVCEENRVVDVIGGFHLMSPNKKQLESTLDYFKQVSAEEVHACHCVDLDSKIALSRVSNLKEVGSGLQLSF